MQLANSCVYSSERICQHMTCDVHCKSIRKRLVCYCNCLSNYNFFSFPLRFHGESSRADELATYGARFQWANWVPLEVTDHTVNALQAMTVAWPLRDYQFSLRHDKIAYDRAALALSRTKRFFTFLQNYKNMSRFSFWILSSLWTFLWRLCDTFCPAHIHGPIWMMFQNSFL